MNKKRLLTSITAISERVCRILPVFFWLFLIFGFEEPLMAIITLFSALLHECGHIGYILLKKEIPLNLKGVISGFRIKNSPRLSYREEMCLYLSGPAVNLGIFVIASLLARLFGKICPLIATINLATALSNLAPIEGYDGYGAILAYLREREVGETAEAALRCLSTALIFLLTLLSLYFIDRFGGGYWIFVLFFISTLRRVDRGLVE